MGKPVERKYKYQRMTLEDRKIIEKGIKENYSHKKIAATLQRLSRQAVCVEILKNGGKANYNAEKAHAQMLENRKKQKPLVTIAELAQTVRLMQMQIDILTDTITDFMEKHEKK